MVADPGVRAVLADVAAVNLFFAVAPECAGPGWLPVGELGRRADLLAGEVATVRAALAEASGCTPGQVEGRVAASLFYQGLASRLLSPVIGAALAHGRVPDPAGLCWRRDRRGPLVFALGEGTPLLPVAADRNGNGNGTTVGTPLRSGAYRTPRPDGAGSQEGPSPETVADLVRTRVLEGVLRPVGAALRAQVRVAERLLWGNAASALAGAVGSLARARPALAADARALAAALLARPPLAGLGRLGPEPGHGFTRTTCCLYYRLPGAGMCGDCALLPSARRSRAQGR
ncbi:IucA/IucC family C-terminal-domain containing protein [Nocardiopsis sediminis]|uniref:IucA/IucC family C-terminal-domain containing protein n=1 Tax=Nocardiopsis sediminis TaxID=1778267 RepID=A0ABV8FRJ6_9ACTN